MPTFEVLINDCFANISTDSTLEPVDNKYILSLINDFEDGKWRSSKFHQFIWNNVAQTALSAEERDSLADESSSLLVRSAQNLRLTDQDIEEGENIGRGSELAEILLYGLMKEHYKALTCFFMAMINFAIKQTLQTNFFYFGDKSFKFFRDFLFIQ